MQAQRRAQRAFGYKSSFFSFPHTVGGALCDTRYEDSRGPPADSRGLSIIVAERPSSAI